MCANDTEIYTVRPRFTNASDREQCGLRTNFPNTKRLGWRTVLRTRKPSTSWSDKLGASASAVFVEEWSSGKNPESAAPIGESVSCCVAFVVFIFFCDRFNGFHWFRVTNLCTKYCCNSLNKQSSGFQERINPFYINSYGKNSFGLRTFRFTNALQERIKFVNRGLIVYNI